MLKERVIKIMEWNKPGTTVGGYLLSVTRNKFKDGGVGLTYAVKATDESRLVFKGATRLDMALSLSDVGKYIQVEYVGEDATKEAKEGMNRPKVFRVSVDDERTLTPTHQLADPSDPGISDADIGF